LTLFPPCLPLLALLILSFSASRLFPVRFCETLPCREEMAEGASFFRRTLPYRSYPKAGLRLLVSFQEDAGFKIGTILISFPFPTPRVSSEDWPHHAPFLFYCDTFFGAHPVDPVAASLCVLLNNSPPSDGLDLGRVRLPLLVPRPKLRPSTLRLPSRVLNSFPP